MTIEELAPAGIAPPAANYAHGVLTVGAARMIHTCGVVGTLPDGTVPDAVGEQAVAVWANIAAILAAGGLELTDIVSYTTYVVDGNDLGAVMAARDHAFGSHRAASTLIPVSRLAQPAWKVEVTAVAAR